MFFLPSNRPKRKTLPLTPEQIGASIARDKALTVRAERRLKEQEVERGEIDLAKRRMLLIAGSILLGLLLVALVSGTISVLLDPAAPLSWLLTGGGGFVSLLVAWIRWG
jgi:hypothetical protein